MHSRTPWWERLAHVSFARKRPLAPSARVVSTATFRELLVDETIRSERSGHFCRILILYTSNGTDAIVPMEGELSRKVMAVLSTNLRKTDSIGWYREGTIVGALLTVVEGESSLDLYHLLKGRLSNILRTELPDTSDALRFKICTQEEVHQFDSW